MLELYLTTLSQLINTYVFLVLGPRPKGDRELVHGNIDETGIFDQFLKLGPWVAVISRLIATVSS